MAKAQSRGGTRTLVLVYARRSPEDAEPLIAVLPNEAALDVLRAEFATRWPGVEVRWEDQPVRGDGGGDEVHLVVQGGESDPVIAGVYATREAAEVALKEEAEGFASLRSLPVGWRADGQPWEA